MKRGVGAVLERGAKRANHERQSLRRQRPEPTRAAPDTASGVATDRDVSQEESRTCRRTPAARGPHTGAAV